MAIVRRVGVLSLGKVLGTLYGTLGLIFGALISLLALAGAFAQGRSQGPGALMFGAGAVVILPVFYGVIGFVMGIIVGALYNVIASIAGGIELELEQPAPPSAFPVAGPPWQR